MPNRKGGARRGCWKKDKHSIINLLALFCGLGVTSTMLNGTIARLPVARADDQLGKESRALKRIEVLESEMRLLRKKVRDLKAVANLLRYHRDANTIEIMGGANLWLHTERGKGGNLIIGEEHDFSQAADSLIMGRRNQVSGSSNLISGTQNQVDSHFSFVTSSRSEVRGMMTHSISGDNNLITGHMGVGIGGHKNNVTGSQAVVLGGMRSVASGPMSTIVSGDNAETTGLLSLIAGGQYGRANGNHSVVLGGFGNKAEGYGAWAAGGEWNVAKGWWSSAGMGYKCLSKGYLSVVIGGRQKQAVLREETHFGAINATSSGERVADDIRSREEGFEFYDRDFDQERENEKENDLLLKAERSCQCTLYRQTLLFLGDRPGFVSEDQVIEDLTCARVTEVHEERLKRVGLSADSLVSSCFQISEFDKRIEDAEHVYLLPRTDEILKLHPPYICSFFNRSPPQHFDDSGVESNR